MLFPEEDASLLKAWIVQRIEDTSDADADVLAEYVIALLKHDGDANAVRKLCEQEIPDFLSEDPKAFLDDVFQAIAYKSYLPGAPPAPKIGVKPETIQQPSTETTTPNGSKKRGYHDREEYDPQVGYDAFNQDGRAQKQARRGGRGGRGDDMRGGHAGGFMHNLPPRPDMSFDPKAMEAFLQMGSMGLPYPGMPNFPQQGFGGKSQSRKRGRCRDFDTKGFCSRGSTCPYDHGNESIFMPSGNDEYDPNDPFAMLANAPNPMNPWLFTPDANRGGRGGRRGRGSKKGGARAPFSADGPNYDRSKSTIVVENIPEESFSEDQVREFFSQFGNIQEISMQPYKHLAIVKYDKWGPANAAYQSPKVIFDNRFVKVFWYKDKADALPPSAPMQEGNWSGDPMATEEDEQEPEIDMEEFQRKQEEEQRKHHEREAKRAEIEQKRQEIEKQHHELLARHREENEKLQARLAGKKGQEGEGSSSGTSMLRAKLAALEREATLLGLDPNAEEEASPSWHSRGGYRGRGTYRGRGFAPRGRGSYRGRGGGGGGGGNMHAAYAQYSIDNRPKKLAIKGVDFTAPDKDEMLRHFLLNLGEFESVDTGPEVTHVSFQDRKTAEKFYYSLHGKDLPGVEGRLELAWVSSPLPPVRTRSNDDGSGDGGYDKEDDAMAGFDDQPKRERSAEPQPEDRAVNMDYEVAEEDAW
ncbi:hypothetical protein FPOAC2_12416 [Fusarium poae]|uniref:C3H1-type domain-containing protein n=1 Tax=Fusarium poae TaxID=36050 RepID=A0A1B8AG59_FUSPO|nr:hypothetical protein FPOAC1_012084 [Fusarium poae]KAG8667258.1 hypothetical protein FPOAC1_012084 [Fusarium poae]OBS19488.1 hypothetical protein FPOA_11214 [Fusarium poae]